MQEDTVSCQQGFQIIRMRIILIVWIACFYYVNGLVYLPSGLRFNDVRMDKSDDDSKSIPTSATYKLFGKSYDHVFINTNGILSFGHSFPWFDPESFPINDTKAALIAVLWADFDPSHKGAVYYRETTNPEELDYVESEIATKFIGCNESFNASHALVVTWRGTYFHEGDRHADPCVWEDPINDACRLVTVSSGASYEDKSAIRGRHAKTNTNNIQAIMITDSSSTYLMMNYRSLTWSTGDFSDGINGKGGHIARMGFNSANGEKYYNHPDSGRVSIYGMKKKSIMYRIHGSQILNAECSTIGMYDEMSH